jgi:hypothetical protein
MVSMERWDRSKPIESVKSHLASPSSGEEEEDHQVGRKRRKRRVAAGCLTIKIAF